MSTSALTYLEKAVKAVAPFNIVNKTEAPITTLIQDLQPVDETRAVVIARTLQQSTIFNEIARSQVADMSIGSRHESIANTFDSIIEDSKNLLKQVEENRNGFKERVGRAWMKMSRGTVHKRFDKIKDIYLDVVKDTADQLTREKTIIEAYLDYRSALKEAEIDAAKMFKVQEVRLEDARKVLVAKNDAIAPLTDPEEKARAQLERDEAQRVFDLEDRRYQLIKEVSEQLSTAYNVGDVVIANLNQTRKVKQAVFDKAVIFFHISESIFTGIDANLTSTAGLSESHRAVDAYAAGANKGLETLAEVSGTVKLNAIKTAFGVTIKADSLKKLVESMVKFQSESITEIKRLREESTKNTVEIGNIVEKGKNDFTKLITA